MGTPTVDRNESAEQPSLHSCNTTPRPLSPKGGVFAKTACFLLFACVLLSPAVWAKNIELKKKPVKKEAAVFGELVVVGGWYGDRHHYNAIRILDNSTSEIVKEWGKRPWGIRIYRGASGPFYWSLPEGEYAILDYREVRGNRWRDERINAVFTVPQSGAIVYVGALVISIDASGTLSSGVEDHYDAAVKEFRKEYPNFKGNVT